MVQQKKKEDIVIVTQVSPQMSGIGVLVCPIQFQYRTCFCKRNQKEKNPKHFYWISEDQETRFSLVIAKKKESKSRGYTAEVMSLTAVWSFLVGQLQMLGWLNSDWAAPTWLTEYKCPAESAALTLVPSQKLPLTQMLIILCHIGNPRRYRGSWCAWTKRCYCE